MTQSPGSALDLRHLVRCALEEDVGTGDITTAAVVRFDQMADAVVLAKSRLVVAGVDAAAEAFRQLDPDVRFTVVHGDGARCEPQTVIATLRGRAAAIITAERTALNFLQRLSGIATLTRQFVDAAGGRIAILDTRKTTPLLRRLEKDAVRAGGGVNHRFGLFDGVLIKDNHIRLAGGVREAVARMRAAGAGRPVEVEAQDLEQVDEALAAGADIILLDNMSTADIVEAVGRCRGRAKIEISGGVTLERIPELAASGADFVSVGALTHSAPAADISLEMEPVEP